MSPDGKPLPFSTYGLNTSMLDGLFNGISILEEYTKDGKTWLRFKDEKIADVFKERGRNLAEGYAILLAFEALSKKLSPIYEADMAEHVAGRLAMVRGFIEERNKAIRTAANPEEGKKNRFILLKEPMQFDEDWIIDVERIKPERSVIEEHEEKLKEIFPNI